MKKLLSLSVFALLFAFVAQAQNPEITFASKVNDFGNIQEADGMATTTFEFTNTGSAPLVISGVTASCGCTTPDWTKTPVLPGETGFVKASYNAKGRPGIFSKSVTVRSNAASEATTVLTIKGEVIAAPKVEGEQK